MKTEHTEILDKLEAIANNEEGAYCNAPCAMRWLMARLLKQKLQEALKKLEQMEDDIDTSPEELAELEHIIYEIINTAKRAFGI